MVKSKTWKPLKKQTKSITIVVPIPKTNQNGPHGNPRSHASHVKKDVKEGRESAMIAVYELPRNGKDYGFPWDNAKVHVKWYHKTRNFRDKWNMVGCLKGVIDGITRAGILTDDNEIDPPTIERLVDKDQPRVVLTFTKLE